MIKTGSILAGLLLLATAQSTYFFLGKMKLSLTKWFFFNACAPLNILFLIGFMIFAFFKNKLLLYITAWPVLIFAIWGLIAFSWENPFSQLGHIIMLANILWVMILIIQTKDYKTAVLGFVLGLFLSLLFIKFQQSYVKEHWEEFRRVMPLK